MSQLLNQRPSAAAPAHATYDAPRTAARTPSSPPSPTTRRWPLPAATLLEAIEAACEEVFAEERGRDRGLEPQTMRDPR
ncbi:MAG: hypothetical protein AAGH15_28595 [Myxococcota bacterium]